MAPQAPTSTDLLTQLLRDAFPSSRPPRSGAYLDGAREALELLLAKSSPRCDYASGSVSFDAYQAGWMEGRDIWAGYIKSQHQPQRVQPANAADLLAAELLHAEKIILTMSPMLGAAQQRVLGDKLVELGIISSGDAGITRYHERRAALVAAGFATSMPDARQAAQAAG